MTKNKSNQILYFDQEAYLEKILQKTQMISESFKSIKIPINNKNCIHPADPEDEQINRKLYQKKIRLVMYAVINIRLDIIFIIKKLS